MKDDTISRQAALDALLELVEARRTWIRTEAAQKEISGIDASMCAIHDLPSAERHGRWIYLGGLDAFECSVCGRQMVRNIFDYCPWCGSRMDLEGDAE